MKVLIRLFICLTLPLLPFNRLFGQETVVGNKAYFSQNINIEKFEGRRFKLRAATKVNPAAENSKSSLITVIRKKNNTVGFHWDITKNLKNNLNWEVTDIEGEIDSNANTLEIGGYCVNDGVFKFDGFQLQIEVSAGIWEEIPIDDGSFEKGEFQAWISGSNNKSINFDGATFNIDKKDPFDGKYSLVLDCNYLNYGNNKKNGNFAEVNGIKLYYEIYGQGKPLLLLHGNGGSIAGQKVRIADFKNKYKVIAVDNRGQGNSGDDRQELTYDQMADDTNKLLEQINIDSAYIWGQSDGGIIGLILAMKHSDKVKKLATWGANIQANERAFAPKIYESIVKASKTGKTEKERQLNTLMVKYPNIPFIDLKNIKAPVLIMAGDRDAINIEHTTRIFQSIPNSQLFIMPGASHFGAYEKPNLFNTILSDFLNAPTN